MRTIKVRVYICQFVFFFIELPYNIILYNVLFIFKLIGFRFVSIMAKSYRSVMHGLS